MAKITFSKGKSNEQTTTGAITAPSKVILLAGKTAGFSVGDYCFISESDDTELEYLGQITAIDPDVSVTVTYDVAADKASGAKFWKATNILEFEYANEYPASRSEKVHQAVGYTDGGQIYVSTKGVEEKLIPLHFELMTKTNYDELLDWYLNVSEGARYLFQYTDIYRNILTVRLLTEQLEFAETHYQLYAGDLLLRKE